jgi:DNA polymerase-4
LVGVSLSGLIDAGDAPEQLLLGEREKGWRQVDKAIDAATAKYGRGSVRPARLVKLVDQITTVKNEALNENREL